MLPIAALILSASPFGVGPSFSPDAAADVFASHREAILAPGIHRHDDWVFATVFEPVERAGSSVAMGKAEARAAELFVLAATGDPSRCIESPALMRAFVAAAAGIREVRLDASGIQTVHQQLGRDGATVVRAIPAARLEGLEIPCDQVITKIADLAESPDAPSALAFLALEVVPSSRREGAERAARAALAREYPGLAKPAETWERLPAGFLIEVPPDAGRDVAKSLLIASSRTGDATAVESARTALREAGYGRAAELIPLPRITLEPLRQEIRSAMETEVERLFVRAPKAKGAAPWLRLLARFGAAMPLPAPGAAAPAAGTEAFRDGLVDAALAGLLDAGVPGAEAWNLAAVCLRQLDAPRTSLEAARVSMRLDPDHAFAPVNELLALRTLGDREAVARGLPPVESSPRLDAWGRKQVESLRQWLAPPRPETPALPPSDPPASFPSSPGPPPSGRP